MKHHAGGKCGNCDGGQVDDQDAELNDDLEFPMKDCPECGGTDTATWCWQEDDIGHCDFCDAYPDRPVSLWDDNEGENGHGRAICAPCAKKLHAELCGCDEPSWRGEP